MATASNYSYTTIFEGILLYASEAPTYHIILEVLLVLWIVKLLFFTQQYYPDTKDTPTQEEQDELIRDWQPEPLVPQSDYQDEADSRVVSGMAGTYVTVNGHKCLNLATFNFLGLLNKQAIHDVAADTIRNYGVGSCGPRGFYGTMDVHINLEEHIARFTHREEAIIYSFGFAAIASAIPAYSKRNDIIFCDEGVSFPIQKGLDASRSKIKYFKHNDMADLEKLIKEQKKIDDKYPAKAKKTRKFIVAEALYMNYGDIVPLDKLVELRNQYRIPIILEESLSFGVLGQTGRGAVEHFGLSPDDVDIICVSMSMSISSMGGFCAGKSFIIDHQRLSGVGYCFSASLPPFLASAAMEALNIMEKEPTVFSKVRENAVRLHKVLKGVPGIDVQGYEQCPIVHIRLSESKGSHDADQKLLDQIVNESLDRGLAIVTAKYIELDEHKLPQPSIRLAISSEHTEQDIQEAVTILKSIIEKHLKLD